MREEREERKENRLKVEAWERGEGREEIEKRRETCE